MDLERLAATYPAELLEDALAIVLLASPSGDADDPLARQIVGRFAERAGVTSMSDVDTRRRAIARYATRLTIPQELVDALATIIHDSAAHEREAVIAQYGALTAEVARFVPRAAPRKGQVTGGHLALIAIHDALDEEGSR